MQLTICHKVEFGPATMSAVVQLTAVVRALIQREGDLMKTFAQLQADVAANTTVDASVVTLVSGLVSQLQALSAAGTPVDPAAIDALATQLETNTASLSAAVTANTPAAS
jgi:hypothetical protein